MKMLAKPLLSVVIPAYNYASILARAVNSVLLQLDSRCELIVINDGSTDATIVVLEELLQNHPGQFRIVDKPNGGLASVRNRGILEAAGDYLVFLDADDEMVPDALKLFQEHLAQHPSTRMVIGGHVSVSPEGKRRSHSPGVLSDQPLERLRDYLLAKRLTLSNGACAMHREVFASGGYPEVFRSAEDIPVFAQTLANFPCTLLEQPLALIHKHDDSLRHQFSHAKAGGLALVDEVFSPQRLGPRFQVLKPEFYVQRCLSLFRSAYLAGDTVAAKSYFSAAVKVDWRVLLKGSYLRKALRLMVRA
jgi:glycosyltransferase involved in cell wall biosynthesis